MTRPQSCIVGIALLRTRGATDPTLPSAPAAPPTTSVVSLMSGSAILGRDTVGWDLGLSEGHFEAGNTQVPNTDISFSRDNWKKSNPLLQRWSGVVCPKLASKPSSKERLPGAPLMPLFTTNTL